MDIHRCSFLDYTPESITCIAFSHSSTTSNELGNKNLRLAVGRSDGSIDIWNPNPYSTTSSSGDISKRENWVLELTIPGSQGTSIEGLVWASRDQSSCPRLFSIGGSTYLTEWDLKTSTPLVNHDCNAGVIWSLAIDNKHEKIALGCEDGSVVVINIDGGRGVVEHETILQRQKSRVLSLVWTDTGILGGCADGRIRLWNYNVSATEQQDGVVNGRLIQTLRVDKAKGEPTLIWSLAYLPHSKQFVSGDSTGSIKFWDLKHLVLQQSLQVHQADVLCFTSNTSGTKLFSAGVDRKIFEFSYTKMGKNNHKWINSSNRLIHGNDVRGMTSYQAKGIDYLVSAGVERVLHVNSMEDFSTSVTKKLAINPVRNNIFSAPNNRWIVMWQKNEIKIWKLVHDKSKKLMTKMVLQDPDHITDVSLSSNGNYIAVARLTSTKLFKLTELENKIEVSRVNTELLNSVGGQFIKFISNHSIVIYTAEQELYKFKFDNDENDAIFDDEQDVEEIKLHEDKFSNSTYPYITSYNNFELNKENTIGALTKPNGALDIVHFNEGTTTRLMKFSASSPVCAISFTLENTLLVATQNHQVHEFNISGLGSTKTELHTQWSKFFSSNSPTQFINFKGTPKGVFENLGRFWVWGENWICFFESKVLLENGTEARGEKRTRNGDTLSTTEEKKDAGFWSTKIYKDLLFVDRMTDSELVVVERHLEDLPTPPAFKLVKYSL
ncbi:Utp4 protein [Martiniozyma asiatica (nom. inval.)]|nr:Utp4 protein [Martiniozyma asiatica]